MDKKLLPIGSIVLLKGGNKRLMIYGRQQKGVKGGRSWDYVACPYPEGNINENYTYMFNCDQIEQIYFIGFQDKDEFEFQRLLGHE